MKKTLIEYSHFKPKHIINEGFGVSSKFLVEGLVQRAEEKNGNGRIYPYEVLYREVQKYIEGPIQERRALGELDHPDSSVISLKNVSHNILSLWWEGKDLYGKIEILPTPSGNILRSLFENQITVGISSRGMGSVRQLGEAVEVQDDFELMCWDFVSTPSTQGAFMEQINEGMSPTFKSNSQYNKINELITEIICNNTGFCECVFN
jgi:hypothetical protein